MRSGRERQEIKLIAVTKYVAYGTNEERASGWSPASSGENRWQDAQAKWMRYLAGKQSCRCGREPIWHFIGSLQTNKVKDVIGKFTYIHSLDRLSLAQAIDDVPTQLGIVVPCFIQVNVSGEESKHGLAPEGLQQFARELAGMRHIHPIGLMTMAAL